MPVFIYKVRDKQGREIQDSREAQSEEELITQLQKKDLLVISVAREDAAQKQGQLTRQLHFYVSIDDLILFARQLAIMLESGITLLKSLEVFSKQVESKALLKAVQEIKQDIAAGSTFSKALAKHPKIFSDFWVHIVETGEASGALPVALAQLADYLESAADLRRKVVSALIYPSVLITIGIAALIIFTVWIIPIFSRVFDTFGVELPLVTQVVLNFSKAMRRDFLLLAVLFGALVYLGYIYIHSETGQWQLDRLKLKLPFLATLVQQIAIERFASGLATLIESGVPILYGLDIIAKATGNKVVEKAILEVRESVREGKGMARPLERSGVFPPMLVQMVTVGEEIGELGKMLRKVAQFFQERIATTLTRLTTIIEPAVLVIIGIIIGILVIALMLPIFQLAMVARGG